MKLNIAYPATGCQKLIEVDDEHKLRAFYDKRMASEVPADSLGDEWKGYIFRITGGNDKQGFPMKQGVLTNTRVRLLLKKGHSCYRPRRDGERRRKSVRGCIVDANLSVLSLIIVRKGQQEIPGLTDKTIPRRLGPKRASKIRKLFNLSKEDDVRKYVVRRPMPPKDGKKRRSKAPKIQRLVTPRVLQRKKHRLTERKRRADKKRDAAADYAKLLAQRMKEAKERKAQRRSSASKSRSESRASESSSTGAKPAPVKTAKADKKAATAPTKVVKPAPAKVASAAKKDKKATDKKAPAKKSTDKKVTDKKATDKKAPAKKATDKKATDKKATDKKATDKKAPAKEAKVEKKTTTSQKAGAKKAAEKKIVQKTGGKPSGKAKK